MALVVWDYHGVLEQGNENGVLALSNLALEEEGLPQRFTDDDIIRLYGKRWLQYFEILLPQADTDMHKRLEQRALRIDKERPEVRERYIRPTPNSHYVLEQIAQRNDQLLLSNCHDIVAFLRATRMEDYFPEGKRFATAATTPVRSKQELFDSYLHGARPAPIILVGDSPGDLDINPHDITFLYAHPGRDFRQCEADHKIRDLRGVLDYLRTKELL
jgi:phosphoglycolate phosphatase-like HAD superfamily hydrolase